MKTASLFVLALCAFAGNSILARLALLESSIDPASFIAIRIVSGAITLALVLSFVHWQRRVPRTAAASSGSWWGAFTLSLYAVAFSYAYVELETGFGALVLFAAVQLTMISVNIMRGARLVVREWAGCLVALMGFLYLIAPTVSLPDSLLASALMACAGIAWGFYSLHGRGRANPLADTTYNFLRAVPMVALVWLLTTETVYITDAGVGFAILSGAVTSGLGYAIWYLVLPRLTVTSAAIGQLSVPLIAAAGGIVFAGEQLTLQLLIAAALIIGGILLVSWKQKRR